MRSRSTLEGLRWHFLLRANFSCTQHLLLWVDPVQLLTRHSQSSMPLHRTGSTAFKASSVQIHFHPFNMPSVYCCSRACHAFCRATSVHHT
jgi:hypothetical protein